MDTNTKLELYLKSKLKEYNLSCTKEELWYISDMLLEYLEDYLMLNKETLKTLLGEAEEQLLKIKTLKFRHLQKLVELQLEQSDFETFAKKSNEITNLTEFKEDCIYRADIFIDMYEFNVNTTLSDLRAMLEDFYLHCELIATYELNGTVTNQYNSIKNFYFEFISTEECGTQILHIYKMNRFT